MENSKYIMINKNRKRARSPSNEIVERRNNIWDKLNYSKPKECIWVSATKVKNYMRDDPILDWFDLYYSELGLNDGKKTKLCKYNFDNILFTKGNVFEKKIMEELKKVYGDDMIFINKDGSAGCTTENFEKTKNAIYSHIPIIAQGVLYNNNNYTFGIPDLLIRSDYLNKLCRNSVLTHDECGENYNKYYYVVDIKWTLLPFYAKNDNLRKENFMECYKGQLAIYNCALGNIQGYFPNYAYLLGKGWKRDTIIKQNSYDSFDRFGIIDYRNNDHMFINKTIEALNWYRDVVIYGRQWSPFDSFSKKHSNMYPNMRVYDYQWNTIKKEIAIQINEVTLIFNVNKKCREELHARNIYSISDQYCNSDNMGIKLAKDGGKTETAVQIDNICDINRDQQYNIYPRTISNNDENWQHKYPADMFVDCETVNFDLVTDDINIHDTSLTMDNFVFMIGVGYEQNEEWHYKDFTMKTLCNTEQVRCMDEFSCFVIQKATELDPSRKYPVRLFHWSQAEITNFNHLNEKFKNKWNDLRKEVKFVDMWRVFIREQIALNGAFDFKLKSIVNEP